MRIFMRHILCGEYGRNLINAAKNLWKILNFQNTWRFIVKPSVYHVCCLSPKDFCKPRHHHHHHHRRQFFHLDSGILYRQAGIQLQYSNKFTTASLYYSVWLAIKFYIWWFAEVNSHQFCVSKQGISVEMNVKCARQK